MKLLIAILTTAILIPPAYPQTEKDIRAGKNIIHITTFGTGEPVLIINGGPGMNSDGFEPLAKKIGQTNETILYDQRGTGKSYVAEVDSTTITMDSMADDIETIRKFLHFGQWIVMGHSFGGMLASYYTSLYPEHVKALILSSSGGIDMELFNNFNPSSKLTAEERDSLGYWNNKIAHGDTSHYAKLEKAKKLAPLYLYY